MKRSETFKWGNSRKWGTENIQETSYNNTKELNPISQILQTYYIQ